MAVAIESDVSDAICVAEFEERFAEAGIPAQDPDALGSLAGLLKSLNNNRTFIGDLIIEDMVTSTDSQSASAYGAQVMILSRMSRNFFLRAAIWPAAKDEVSKKTDTALFAYEQPHDHNFNFLSSGYFGPGYYSEYFEYDYESLSGHPGEPVELEPIENRCLGEGELLLYRAHRDVHTQFPPQALSITLNIMDSSPNFRNQYLFSNDKTRVERLAGQGCSWPFLDLAASLGGARSVEPLLYIFNNHRDPNTRYHALKAASSVAEDDSGVERIMRLGTQSEMPSVRAWSTRYLGWLSSAPDVDLAREF